MSKTITAEYTHKKKKKENLEKFRITVGKFRGGQIGSFNYVA